MISIDFLESIDIFKNLDDDQLSAIQGCSQIVEFQRGGRLFTEGDDSTHLWIIMEGDVDLRFDSSFDEDIISFISDARIFGWSCFAPPYKYRLSGYCASRRCKIIKIEKDSLNKLFEGDPRLGYQVMSHLLQVIGTQLHQYQDEIAKRRGFDIISQW